MKFLNFLCFDEKGGGIIEYALIIILIALAATATMASLELKL
jgi:Flp pilus assembly pilin Flp